MNSDVEIRDWLEVRLILATGRFTAITLWGSTAFIAYDLSKVSEDIASINADVVKPMKDTIFALLEAADVDLIQKNEKVVRAVKLLLARVQAISDSMNEVKPDLEIVRTKQSVRFATHDSSPEDAADDLMDFIMSVEKVVTPDRRSTGSMAGSPSKRFSDDEKRRAPLGLSYSNWLRMSRSSSLTSKLPPKSLLVASGAGLGATFTLVSTFGLGCGESDNSGESSNGVNSPT